MRRKSKGDREEARRRERSLRQRQDEKIQQECRRARSRWIFRWTGAAINPKSGKSFRILLALFRKSPYNGGKR